MLVSNSRSRPHADTDPAAHWGELGACVRRLRDFEASEAAAKEICGTCPVTTQCLEAALAEEGLSRWDFREGVRGGLNERERASLAARRHHQASPAPAPPVPSAAPDVRAEHAAALLRAGDLGTTAIAAETGLCITSVKRVRRSLGLPPAFRRPRTPLERFTARTTPGEDGHLLWVGGARVHLSRGRETTGPRLAFLVGYGREPQGQVKSLCQVPNCVAWRHLADRPMNRAEALAGLRPVAIPHPVEYLYGVEAGHWQGEEWVADRVVRFPITRKTARRIYYIRQGDQEAAAIGNVDRRQIETDGDVYRASSGHWEPDSRLYLAPPELNAQTPPKQPVPPHEAATDAAWLDAAAAAA